MTGLRLFGLSTIAFLLAMDQVTKWLVLERVFRPRMGLGDPMRLTDWLRDAPERLPGISLILTPFLNFAMVWNEGISFGLMAQGGWGFLTVMSLVIAAVFLIWMWRSASLLEVSALAMIVGGAMGNVYDRVRFGAVADFLDFHWQGWHFPAFNVADSAISVGVALLLVHSLFFAKKSH